MDREECREWQREKGGHASINRANYNQNSLYSLTQPETLPAGPHQIKNLR